MNEAGGPRFYKLSGGGNDFVVLVAPELSSSAGPVAQLTPELARRLCTRRLSLGADGVVLLGPSTRATARFFLRNRDGSAAAFSGNGARCAARVLHELGHADDGRLSLETDDGVVAGEVHTQDGDLHVGIEVARPQDLRPDVGLPAGSSAGRLPAQGDYAIVGVPYLAVPVEQLDELDIERAAPPLRRLADFPDGANVAFYEPPATAAAAVRLRTFERGVEAETLSSGTGCAIVAISLALRSGELVGDRSLRTVFDPRSGIPSEVELDVRDGTVCRIRLVGDARLIARGRLGPDALRGFDPP